MHSAPPCCAQSHPKGWAGKGSCYCCLFLSWHHRLWDKCRHLTHIKEHLEVLEFVFFGALTWDTFHQWGVFRSEALNNRMIFTQLKFQCLLMESKKRQMLHNHAAVRGKSPHERGLQGSGQNLTTVCPSLRKLKVAWCTRDSGSWQLTHLVYFVHSLLPSLLMILSFTYKLHCLLDERK